MSSRFASMVLLELNRARALHGNLRSAHEGYAVILEELEEFKAEVFKRRQDRDVEQMVNELVQTAAMCQRLAEDVLIMPDLHDYTDDLIAEVPPTAPIDVPTEGGAA